MSLSSALGNIRELNEAIKSKSDWARGVGDYAAEKFTEGGHQLGGALLGGLGALAIPSVGRGPSGGLYPKPRLTGDRYDAARSAMSPHLGIDIEESDRQLAESRAYAEDMGVGPFALGVTEFASPEPFDIPGVRAGKALWKLGALASKPGGALAAIPLGAIPRGVGKRTLNERDVKTLARAAEGAEEIKLTEDGLRELASWDRGDTHSVVQPDGSIRYEHSGWRAVEVAQDGVTIPSKEYAEQLHGLHTGELRAEDVSPKALRAWEDAGLLVRKPLRGTPTPRAEAPTPRAEASAGVRGPLVFEKGSGYVENPKKFTVDDVVSDIDSTNRKGEAERVKDELNYDSTEDVIVLYHSGDKSIADDVHFGTEPNRGEWVREVLNGATDEQRAIDAIAQEPPVTFLSDAPDWVVSKVARKLGKNNNDVTLEDVREHGHLAVFKVDADADVVRAIDPDSEGFTNATGRESYERWHETPLYSEGDVYTGEGRLSETPFGVERGDYFTTESVSPEYTLTGDGLVEFLQRKGVPLPEAPTPSAEATTLKQPAVPRTEPISVSLSIQVNEDWADRILSGEKTVETSGQPMTKGGAAPGWVLLRDESGTAKGAARFGERFEYEDEAAFIADHGRHLVESGSPFAFGKRKRTYGFPIEEVVRFDAPVDVPASAGQNRLKPLAEEVNIDPTPRAEAPAVERVLHHASDGPMRGDPDTSGHGFYLSETTEGATRGAVAGGYLPMLDVRTHYPDRTTAYTLSQDSKIHGRDLSIRGVELPETLRYPEEFNAKLEEIARAEFSSDERVNNLARELAREQVLRFYHESSTPSEQTAEVLRKTLQPMQSRGGKLQPVPEGNPAGRGGHPGSLIPWDAFEHSDTPYADALRALGFDVARVGDEGGASYSVLNPGKLATPRANRGLPLFQVGGGLIGAGAGLGALSQREQPMGGLMQ